MKNENHKKLKVLDYLFITVAYALMVGLLIFHSLKFKELPYFYFGISFGVLIVWNKVLPRDKYINKIWYISNSIYVLYGLYGLFSSFN